MYAICPACQHLDILKSHYFNPIIKKLKRCFLTLFWMQNMKYGFYYLVGFFCVHIFE